MGRRRVGRRRLDWHQNAAGIDDMTLIGTYTSSRVTLQYSSAEIGKTIVYLARYVGARNQLGPAGTTTAASVAA